jgi:hypothetical protein
MSERHRLNAKNAKVQRCNEKVSCRGGLAAQTLLLPTSHAANIRPLFYQQLTTNNHPHRDADAAPRKSAAIVRRGFFLIAVYHHGVF